MDEKVLMSQQWINENYNQGIEENGKTGWPTINALIRCLQIELGISPQADSFGAETSRRFTERIRSAKFGDNSNVIGIIQCAMWCKGYSTTADSITTYFGPGTMSGINKLRQDAGLSASPTGEVDLLIMKALLSMDQFKLIIGSDRVDAKVRTAQQYLNGMYLRYTGLMPCDGLYGRNTNKAIIFALQAEEGISIEEATGTFGELTKSQLPTITQNNAVSYKNFVYLFKFALYANGYGDNIDTQFSASTATHIGEFQKFMKLPETKIMDFQTWCSVIISCGDNTRKGTACDTATPLTATTVQTLVNNGYQYVGRYLSGTYFVNGGTASKAMSQVEINTILNAGLYIYPIFQEGGRSVDNYNPSRGEENARKAYQCAKYLGIPENTIIYFAVDFDALDYQIQNNILPYFKQVKLVLSMFYPSYRVGIYGTRNVCTQVIDAGFAETAFVSDMSYGWSGNLGFAMPQKWAFDQIKEGPLGSGSGAINIDNNIASGLDKGFDHLEQYVSNEFEGRVVKIYSRINLTKEGKEPYLLRPADTNLRDGLRVRIASRDGYGDNDYPKWIVKQSPYSEGAYIISSALNEAGTSKEYVLDRFSWGSVQDRVDVYALTQQDASCQEVVLRSNTEGYYNIVMKNSDDYALTADVRNGFYYDAPENIKWRPLGSSGNGGYPTTQLWRIEPSELEVINPDPTGLVADGVYTIRINNLYLGVPAGDQVYAGAPVKLMAYQNNDAIKWKLKRIGNADYYQWSPVCNNANNTLMLGLIDKSNYNGQIGVVTDYKEVFAGFGPKNVGERKYTFYLGGLYPFYLSIQDEIEGETLSAYEYYPDDPRSAEPTIWTVEAVGGDDI